MNTHDNTRTNQWRVDGSYFEACNCTVACPCIFTSPPTEGHCTALLAWHIEKGAYADVALDGLNVVLAAFAPGNMQEGKWQVALYLDKRGTVPQQDALGKIFSGQAGGHLANLVPLIGDVLGVRSVPIDFHEEGRRRSMQIPDVAMMDIEALSGQGGADVTISNHPFTPVPGFPAVVAKSSRANYQDYGLSLEVSEKNGFYCPFTYQAG